MKRNKKPFLILAIWCFAFGAVLILLGSLAKLQHWHFAGILLIIGLCLNTISYLIGAAILIQIIRKK